MYFFFFFFDESLEIFESPHDGDLEIFFEELEGFTLLFSSFFVKTFSVTLII